MLLHIIKDISNYYSAVLISVFFFLQLSSWALNRLDCISLSFMMWNECPLIFGLQVVSANLATILTAAQVSRELMVICVGPPRCHCTMQINNDIIFFRPPFISP